MTPQVLKLLCHVQTDAVIVIPLFYLRYFKQQSGGCVPQAFLPGCSSKLQALVSRACMREQAACAGRSQQRVHPVLAHKASARQQRRTDDGEVQLKTDVLQQLEAVHVWAQQTSQGWQPDAVAAMLSTSWSRSDLLHHLQYPESEPVHAALTWHVDVR